MCVEGGDVGGFRVGFRSELEAREARAGSAHSQAGHSVLGGKRRRKGGRGAVRTLVLKTRAAAEPVESSSRA